MLTRVAVPTILKRSRYYLPARMFALKIAGMNPMGSVREAIEGHAAARHFTELLSSFRSSCHLVDRDSSGFNLWRTPKGEIWAPHQDGIEDISWILAEVAVGVYRPADQSVRSGDTVIDCGANIGMFAREALAGEADLVVAVEPSSANLECLRRNLRAQIESGRVVLRETGLWESKELLPFTISAQASTRSSFVLGSDDEISTALTPVTTLDLVVEDLGLSRVDFIKMDIEGAEQSALRGARKTLIRERPRLAIAVEHELPTILDNAKAVRDTVLKINPAYSCHCGLCIEGTSGLIAPQVLWFH